MTEFLLSLMLCGQKATITTVLRVQSYIVANLFFPSLSAMYVHSLHCGHAIRLECSMLCLVSNFCGISIEKQEALFMAAIVEVMPVKRRDPR